MSVEKTNNFAGQPIGEANRYIKESLKTQPSDSIDHPVLKRLVEKQVDPSKDVNQLYDRMHHRHNRS